MLRVSQQRNPARDRPNDTPMTIDRTSDNEGWSGGWQTDHASGTNS